jgi:hypothetical protein
VKSGKRFIDVSHEWRYRCTIRHAVSAEASALHRKRNGCLKYWAGCHSSRLIFGRCYVQISAGPLVTLTESSWFWLLPNPFPFIIHHPSYHSTLHRLDIQSPVEFNRRSDEMTVKVHHTVRRHAPCDSMLRIRASGFRGTAQFHIRKLHEETYCEIGSLPKQRSLQLVKEGYGYEEIANVLIHLQQDYSWEQQKLIWQVREIFKDTTSNELVEVLTFHGGEDSYFGLLDWHRDILVPTCQTTGLYAVISQAQHENE